MTLKEQSDAELVEELQNGSEHAFNVLYERYHRLIYYIAYKQCKSDADCKDIVQETFIEMKRSIHSLKNSSALKFWLNQIAISKCINLFKKNKYPTASSDQQLLVQERIQESRQYMLPDKQNKRLSDQDVLNRLVEQLPLAQKQVVILFYLEQFSIEEVAQIMNIPLGTVKSRLSYARADLKKMVETYEHENGIKLNFHSLTNAIVLALSAEYVSFQLPVLLPLPTLTTSVASASKTSVFSTTAAKWILVSTLLGVTGVGGAYLLANRDSQNNIDLSNAVIADTEVEEENAFPQMVVKGTAIDSSRSAYFNLKAWACCEEEMHNLSSQELHEISRVYDALKQINSTYYEQLVEEGWDASFENAMTENKK